MPSNHIPHDVATTSIGLAAAGVAATQLIAPIAGAPAVAAAVTGLFGTIGGFALAALGSGALAIYDAVTLFSEDKDAQTSARKVALTCSSLATGLFIAMAVCAATGVGLPVALGLGAAALALHIVRIGALIWDNHGDKIQEAVEALSCCQTDEEVI